jgi:hypothetical protein
VHPRCIPAIKSSRGRPERPIRTQHTCSGLVSLAWMLLLGARPFQTIVAFFELWKVWIFDHTTAHHDQVEKEKHSLKKPARLAISSVGYKAAHGRSDLVVPTSFAASERRDQSERY